MRLASQHEELLTHLATQEEELIQKSHQYTQIRREEEEIKAELESLRGGLEQIKQDIREKQEKTIALRGSLGENMVTSNGEDEGSRLAAEKKTKETEINRLKAEISGLRERVKNTETSRKSLKKREELAETLSRRVKGVGNVEEELLKWKSAYEKLGEVIIPSLDLKALKSEKESLIKQVKSSKSTLTTYKKTLSDLLSRQVSLQAQQSQAQSALTHTKALFQTLQSTPRLGLLLPARSFHLPVTSIAQQLIAGEGGGERTSDREEVCNEKLWEKCLGLERGTVYESWDVRVSFCRLVWEMEGRIVLQIEEMTREKATEVTIVPVPAEEYSLCIAQLQGKRTAWVASCICYKAFSHSPTVYFRYCLHSAPRSFLIRLPLTAVDLLKPSKSLGREAELLWNSLSPYETESPLSGLSSLLLSDIAELLKYHGAFNVLSRQNCPFLPSDSCLGLGTFQTKAALAMVGRKEDNWVLAVRSPSTKLRTALTHALTCQFAL